MIICFIDFFPPLIGINTTFFSSDCVQIVLCERYTAFCVLTHGRADFPVAGCVFPVLCGLSLSQPWVQFS